MRSIPFRAQKHTITTALESYIEDLLASGCYTLKEIAERTGVGAHLVGEIDKARLSRLYTDQTELGPVIPAVDIWLSMNSSFITAMNSPPIS